MGHSNKRPSLINKIGDLYRKNSTLYIEATPTHLIREIAFYALITLLILEGLNQRSIFGSIHLLSHNPPMFMANWMILIFTYSFALLLRKSHYGYLLITTCWLALGLISFATLFNRSTPLTGSDFMLLGSLIPILPLYLKLYQMILIGTFSLLLIYFLFIIGKKIPGIGRSLKTSLYLIALLGLVMTSSLQVGHWLGAIKEHDTNVQASYQKHGFTYSFLNSLMKVGITQPKSYSEEAVEAVIETISKEEVLDADETREEPTSWQSPAGSTTSTNSITETNSNPNVIIVQLESFFDITRLSGVTYNQDPLPNIHKLMDHYSHGFLEVPTIGGGTVNTEFEVLTGMSLAYFGSGEYPYTTVLTKNTTESLPFLLNKHQYVSHALHNNMGSFYDRNLVYPHLGFNDFTSVEYMNNVETNPLGWAKDTILTTYIDDILSTTEEKDFIFTVSVQPHGKYPDKPVIDAPVILPSTSDPLQVMENQDMDKVSGSDSQNASDNNDLTSLLEGLFGEENYQTQNTDETQPMLTIEETAYNQFLYYANQIYETDVFVGQLIDSLDELGEPTIVVFYGDHLPSLNMTQENLASGDPFDLDYVIWNNYGLKEQDCDMYAYQLGAHLMKMMDFHDGILNRFHQTMYSSDNYQTELELLQYDMLYGDKTAYQGSNPYEPTEMTMGIHPISIDDCHLQGDFLAISGQNFTPYSVVLLDSEQVTSYFFSENLLLVPAITPEDFTYVEVAQITETGKTLSTCPAWTQAPAK